MTPSALLFPPAPVRQRPPQVARLLAAGLILGAHAGLIALLAHSAFSRMAPPEDSRAVVVAIDRPPPPAPVRRDPQREPRPVLRPRPAQGAPPQRIEPLAVPPDLTVDPPLQGGVELTTPTNAAPAATRPRVLTGARFEKIPSPEDLARFYPERAARLDREGAATVRCIVTREGRLSACAVLSETPEGFGFGDAALKAAGIFRLRPATEDGAPVDGAAFVTNIVFRLPS